jgi:8-hydroxy-5-deazaflavin:NADPH oxidoreductase
MNDGMRIAVIGTGNIGGTLGSRWREAGQDVVYGSRDPGGTGPGGAPLAAIPEAVAGAEVVLIAVPGPAVPEVVSALGGALDGKVVIDAANRRGELEANSHAAITDVAPGARYARAFNTLGWENFADPLPGTDLFFASDPRARATVEELISAIGLGPVYVGDAGAVRAVDALLGLWFALTQQNGTRKVAFRLVR